MGRCATAVGGRTIKPRCVEQGETPHPGVHPHQTDHKTEKTIGQQASQAAGRKRRERWWQVLQERHSQQTQERRRPSQEDTLAKTGKTV